MRHKGNFDLDLKLGQIAEEEVKRLLVGRNHLGESVKIEVKDDMKMSETGNIYVEYEYKGQPSGLKTTDADEWWITSSNHGHMLSIVVTVSYFKSMINALVKEGVAIMKSGGDNDTSRGVIVPLYALFTDFRKRVEEDDEEVRI